LIRQLQDPEEQHQFGKDIGSPFQPLSSEGREIL
jgi:hypothetical protein